MTNSIRLLILAVVGLGILLMTTQPNQLPSIVLILPFLLILLIVFLGVRLLFGGKSGRISGSALLIAGLVVIFLALQSLGQLTPRDMIMLSILFATAYFYMYRRASKAN